jgi:hypothetical protein
MKKNFSYLLVFLLIILSNSSSCSSGHGLKVLSSYDGAILYTTTTTDGDGHIKVLRLHGSFTGMGRQYGYLLKDYLTAYYQDIVLDYLIDEKDFLMMTS